MGLLACALVQACVGDEQSTTDGGQDATPDVTPQNDGGVDAPVDSPADTAQDVTADAAVDPQSIIGSNLQLWLTSDKGMTCVTTTTPNRVTTWADQSGHNRDATAATANGARCNVHSINSIDVPYLSAPGSSSPYNDEIFTVDLSFLVNTAYTVAIVEKRWADHGSFASLIGTIVPGEAQADPGDHDKAFGFAFAQGNLVVDQYYDRPLAYNIAAAPDSTAHFVIAWFAPTVGHRLYVDGNDVDDNLSDAGLAALIVAQSGVIGSSEYINAFDDRFQGDIAEIIVADAALSPSALNQLGSYVKTHWGLSF